MTSSTSLLVLERKLAYLEAVCAVSLTLTLSGHWGLQKQCFKRWKMLTASLSSLGQVILYTFVISSLPSFHSSVTVE